jgi:flavin reductase (DIM6/NTAB) family NADH-FMN oxidoreductase RutF
LYNHFIAKEEKLVQPIADMLRQAMRHWTTGVSVVTSQFEGHRHGMTVNSFTSISLDPPHVVVTLANRTRTCALVRQSGTFSVNILRDSQQEISDRFAGRIPEDNDRFHGLEVLTSANGLTLLTGCLAGLDCKVIHTYEMPDSTLFVGEVLEVLLAKDEGEPLLYHNRSYRRLIP